jgi:hypothetical protein
LVAGDAARTTGSGPVRLTHFEILVRALPVPGLLAQLTVTGMMAPVQAGSGTALTTDLIKHTYTAPLKHRP